MDFTTHGVVLSTVLFQCLQTKTDLEGFIFGKRTTKVLSSAPSDGSKPPTATLQPLIALQNFEVTGNGFSFYDSQGGLLPHTSSLLHERPNQIWLGWFKFRSNSSLRPTIREINIHSHLNQLKDSLFPSLKETPLVFGLFTSKFSPSTAVHTLDYKFMSNKGTSVSLAPFPVQISNLMNSSQEEYQAFSPVSSLYSLFSTAQPSQGTPPPHVAQLESLALKAIENSRVLADQVHATNAEIRQLEREIELLSHQQYSSYS